MTSIDIGYPRTSELNQQIYQNLKQALWLQLRRQVFLAVCDDLGLRDSLVAILPAELTALQSQGFTPSIKNKKKQIVSPLSPNFNNPKTQKYPYPPLVTIDLNIKDPNPINQIGQWLAKHPNRDKSPGTILPIFQILGVENLTRQPPEVQWSFLRNLREIESSLSALELSLLLWIPRPWLNAIEHSAPEFWRCRTKVFEFEGEPTLPINKSLTLQVNNKRNNRLQPPPPPPSPRTVKIAKSREPSLYPLPLKITELDRIAEKPAGSLEFLRSPKKSEHHLLTSQWKIDKEKFTSLVELVLADISENLDNEEYNTDNFGPLEILQELQQLLGNAGSEVSKIALAFEKLGNCYRDRLSAGNVSLPNFTIAIHAYELLLELIIPVAKNSKEVEVKYKKSRDNWSIASLINSQTNQANYRLPLLDIFNDLGTVYWMLFRQPANKSNGKIQTLFYLERAIVLYQIAASKIDKKTQPETYVRVQKNLGTALGDLGRHREPAENLCRSVVAYQEAVLHCNLEANPQQYAATLNNLGAAYWNLAQHGQAGERLLGAISAYSEALRYSKPEEEPLNYGMLQNNLATAYWNLSQIEGKVELLLKAIEAYNEALKYRTPDRVPAACAATNNNLGAAYWHLASATEGETKQKLNYLQEAIAAYTRALKLARELSVGEVTFDVLAANNNLGLAHRELATETASLLEEANCRSHLEAALKHHLLAYTGWEKLFASPDFQSGKPKSQSEGTALAYIVKTVRAFYDRFGLEGQNFALSKLPGNLLPEILRRL